MKNIFRYIAVFVAFSAATLTSGIFAYGQTSPKQNLPEGTYLEDNGIAFAKRATVNDNGTYTIDLESFVTGEVTQTFEAVPVDVVLVLDVSGSMSDHIKSYTYTVATHTNITADYGGWTDNQKNTNPARYYKYGDDYYPVYIGRGGTQYNRHYFLFFTVKGVRYHINSNGQIVTEEPTNVTSSSSNLWPSSVTLYSRDNGTDTGVSKMEALQTAVNAFINQIAHNDLYEDDTDDKPRSTPLGNQISIVKFGLARYYGGTASITNPGNHFCNDPGWGQQWDEGTQSNSRPYNCTEVVVGFTPTATKSDVTILTDAVSGLVASGATAADYGMNLARLLINSLDQDPTRANSNKTVVFFTDGAPTHGSQFDDDVADDAIDYANSIKTKTYGEGEDATHPSVFSVGVFDGGATSQISTFMTNVSSGGDYFMDASGGTAEDLKAIFTAIAHSAGGSGNTQVSGGSSVTVDIVSSSFSVPKGFEDNPAGAVTVLVAPCNGKTTIGGKEYFTFGTAKAPSDYGFSISPSISESDNKVSTTGFDYSENWCGPDPTSDTGWHGYKQIIRFIISVNDDAVGGPDVATNESESGIYLEGSDKPLITFNRPTVKLPVQIWIQKQGLRPGDSAVLTLSKAPFAENFNPATATWTNFTKVVVSYDDMEVDDDGNPTGLVKIVGLDPDYYYRLKEDAWAFGYTYQYGGVQYTVGDNVQNPFIFVNVPKEVKYDEASLRNVFAEKTAASGGSEGGESGESGEGN